MADTPSRGRQAHDDRDVLVVGAGVAGLFCAYYLRLAGADVTVVERGEVGGPQSCSAGNTGFVGTQGAAPLAEPGVLRQGLRWLASKQSPFSIRPRPSPELAAWLWRFSRLCNETDARACFTILVEMKRRSLEIVRELCAEPGLADTFTMPGMIVAFSTEQGFDKACRSVPQSVARGVPLRVVSRAELAVLEPGVEFDVYGALLNAEGAALRVPAFLVEFAGLLERMGVRFVPGAQVTGFGSSGGLVTQVRTTRGDFAPDEVVIAAGSWSAAVARMLGVSLLLQPAKGYTVTVKTPAGAPRMPVLLSEGKVALMPLGERLRFGGTLELAGFDTSVSRKRVDGIVATVRSYLPGLEIGDDREIWSGFRPCTPDSLPYLGRAGSYRNLSVACGHGYIGLGLAPVSGKLIAQLVAGEQPDIDVGPFRAAGSEGAELSASIGVLCLETAFTKIRGHIRNPATFGFPVVYKVVSGATPERVVSQADPSLLDPFIAAARELADAGVAAITSGCGFLVLFQRQLAAAVDIPLYASSLIQLPMVARMLRPDQVVGLLVAKAESLTTAHLAAIGGEEVPVRVVGMAGSQEFREVVLEGRRTSLDVERLRGEVIEQAGKLAAGHDDLGAVVIECTDLVPFSRDIQERLKVPVFDIVTLTEMVQHSLSRQYYRQI